jgi:tetratricopeptide (TPR) repeat protein
MTERHELERESLYRDSLLAFQEGRWEDAIEGFESLLHRYPDDEELRQFLTEARNKARLASVKRSAAPRWKQKLVPLVMAAVALAIVFGLGYWIVSAYESKVAPKREALAVQQKAENYVRAGTKALAVGDYDAAERDFRNALAIDPNLEKAKTGLQEAQKGKRAQDLYDRAMAAVDDGRLEEALGLLRELQRSYPEYGDVSRQIEQIERQMETQGLLEKADAAYAAGKWAEAARLYTQFVQSHPSASNREIEGKLYTAYLRQGEELVKKAPSGPETLQQAEKMFREALRWKPRDPVALAYLDRIERYREGTTALQAGNPLLAISTLRGIYMEDPTFLGGRG